MAMDVDVGGYPSAASPLGWLGRTRMDMGGRPFTGDGHIALRVDGLALLQVAGEARGPLSLDALLGLSMWPRLVTAPGDTDGFFAYGAVAGARLRAWSPSPRLAAELELTYAPLLGSPRSGRLHHVEAASTLTWFPWGTSPIAPGFELLFRRGLAWGGGPDGSSTGTAILGGVRFELAKR